MRLSLHTQQVSREDWEGEEEKKIQSLIEFIRSDMIDLNGSADESNRSKQMESFSVSFFFLF